MRKYIISILLLLFLSATSLADTIVTCTTPTTNADGTPLTDLAGIQFYHRLQTTPTYSTIPSATVVTSVTNTDVTWRLISSQTSTFCFVAYAYDTSGNVSQPSNEICKRNEDRVAPLAPVIRLSWMQLEPTSFVSTTVGMSRYKTVSAANQGQVPVTITRVTLLGPDADFRTASYALPRTLAPGSSTSFRVYFEPKVVGTRYTIVRLSTNLGEQDVPLSGIGK